MGTITIDVAAQLDQAPSQSGWIKIPLAYGATDLFDFRISDTGSGEFRG